MEQITYLLTKVDGKSSLGNQWNTFVDNKKKINNSDPPVKRTNAI
jgi:hypothetical protein